MITNASSMGFSANDEAKEAKKPPGQRQIWDLRCLLHVIFVEYRWIWLYYYTFYVLIMSTTGVIDTLNPNSGPHMNQYIACDGQEVWRKKHDEMLRERMWSSTPVDYIWEAEGGVCQSERSLCFGATQNRGSSSFSSRPDGAVCVPDRRPGREGKDYCCRVDDHFGEMETSTFYMNMILLVATMPVLAGLSLYQFCCKRGHFDRSFTASEDYIQSLHHVQIREWYRTYTNALYLLIFPISGYGAYQLNDKGAAQGDYLTFIVGVIALIQIVPSPRRFAPKKLDYDKEAVKENRTSCVEQAVKIFNWNSTDYHENSERIRLMVEDQAISGDDDANWMKRTNLCEVPCIC